MFYFFILKADYMYSVFIQEKSSIIIMLLRFQRIMYLTVKLNTQS